MQSRTELRLLACLAPPLAAVGLAMMISCRDVNTPSQQRGQRSLVAPDRGGAAALAARARIHQRNDADWVGVAHNRAIDNLREEMRKPGVLSRRLCDHILGFVTRPERVPSAHRNPAMDSKHAAERVLAGTVLCRSRFAEVRDVSMVRLASFATASPVRVGFPQTSSDLVNQIEVAVATSSNSGDLAVRLSPILDAAAFLEPVERTAIAATVSVAQSSFEYWEVNAAAFAEEVRKEYSDCKPSGDAGTSCMNDGYSDSALQGSPDELWGRAPAVGFTFTAARRCSATAAYLDAGFRSIIKADAKGAFAGFFGTILNTGNLDLAILGGLAGGAAASIAVAFELSWDQFWCLMAPR